ncbi:hypothetical protein AK830_g10613 [Neonectria ditissima]|uniref:Uncharacterized protein n=1 Tax=Neonectria ditissima TaxID=78410 RepID=A0A0P7B6U8_9HYPO|nr:hypothetical protein AK830_g10613 [Neonectria ditissima]
MADPLSFTASLIAVSTLAVQVSKLVKHTLHASDEALALEGELEGVKSLTNQLERLCQEPWPEDHQATVDEASRVLEGAIQTRLRSLQDYLAKHSRGSKLKLNHVTWAVLRRKINGEREGLRVGKERLFDAFQLLNNSITGRLGLQATQMSIVLGGIQKSQHQNYQDIVARISQCLGPINSIQISSTQSAEMMQLMQRVQIGIDELNLKLPAQGSRDSQKKPGPAIAYDITEPKPNALTTSSTPDWQQAPQPSNCALWCTCACHSSPKHLSLPANLDRLIIFGQSKSNLDQMLRDLPHLTNQQDAYGLTPLHWAATRGDVKSISTLLEHKADVHIVERGGSTPLIWGIDSANPDVTRKLLEAGADPNHASRIWLDRAIHIAYHEERFHCQVPVLLEYNADASASSRLRDSPLEFAASRDFLATVEALFDATPASKHTKAVVAAVKNNAVRSLRRLLELGASCLGVDASGKSVWHHAAMRGTEPTLRLLTLYKRHLPPKEADSSGRFPIDYVAVRSAGELSPSVVESLSEIDEDQVVELEEANYLEARDENEEEDESELEFEDAVQELAAL